MLRPVSTHQHIKGQSVEAYSSSLTKIAKTAISRYKSQAGSTDDHLHLLDINQKTLEILMDTTAVQSSSKPTLFHPDLHTRNIFLAPEDPTQIKGVIDWQSTAIEPAFTYAAMTPDFAEELPLDRTLDAHLNADLIDAQADAQRCASTWAVLVYTFPGLGKAAMLDPLLCRYMAAGSLGWLEDAVPIRSLLADLSQRWKTLELPGDCPYQPSPEETKSLSKDLEEMETTQRLRMYLSRLIRCETDGWVAADRWEEILPVYRGQFEGWIQTCAETREEDEDETAAIKKGQRLWPFDQR